MDKKQEPLQPQQFSKDIALQKTVCINYESVPLKVVLTWLLNGFTDGNAKWLYMACRSAWCSSVVLQFLLCGYLQRGSYNWNRLLEDSETYFLLLRCPILRDLSVTICVHLKHHSRSSAFMRRPFPLRKINGLILENSQVNGNCRLPKPDWAVVHYISLVTLAMFYIYCFQAQRVKEFCSWFTNAPLLFS